MEPSPIQTGKPTFKEALRVWTKVAMYSFGGPAGQIAVMHRLLVEEKRWISEARFLHALNYCMLLPGPEAQQLTIYIGWLLHGRKGGLVAGTLFVLPGFVSILLLSILYAMYQDVTFVQALFFGIKPAVLAIVIGAVVKIGNKALKNAFMIGIAALAFIAIFFLQIDFPYIILAAGLIGFIGGKIREDKFYVIKGHAVKEGESAYVDRHIQVVSPSLGRTVKTAVTWISLWLLPLLALQFFLGRDHILVEEGWFFSKTAVVTFGGAYAVLGYITQVAVETYGWLQPTEMLDGLGMAETTPGPLIQVVQFVGFMGAYRFSGSMDPLLAGVLGSAVVTWATFVPCFLFIFLGAPYIEYLRGNKSLSTILSGITAAVVGVILNLGIWFSINTLFRVVNEKHIGMVRLLIPQLDTLDVASLLLTIIAFGLYFWLKLDMLKVLGITLVLGLAFYFISVG
jgi:chromate transporter